MWPLTIIRKKLDAPFSDRDAESERFMEKEYHGLLQFSSIYPKLDRKRWLPSVLQLAIMVSALSYNWALLVYATVLVLEVDVVLFCQSAHFALLSQLTWILLVLFQLKRAQLRYLHHLLITDFYDYQEPPTAQDDALRASVRLEKKRFILIPIAVAFAGALALFLAPNIDKGLGTFDFNRTAVLFDKHLPYDYVLYPYSLDNWPAYCFTVFTQCLLFGLPTILIGSGGFLFLNVAQGFTLQIRKLQNSLDNIEDRAMAMCRKRFGEKLDRGGRMYGTKYFPICYRKCFQQNFEHHQIIMRGYGVFVDVASAPIFLSYMTGTIVIALSLVSTGSAKELPGTTLASMVLCGVEVGYMFLFSFFGQRFEDMSQDLRFKFYNLKWYYCSYDIRKSLHIIQTVTQRPLEMKAGGIVPTNMETFSKVMNSAYSYYNLVVAFGKV